ncbi:MAG: baseplate J/gp47 family protein [Oscillospiraceae bacterium]|nr:baseplate J/gp47 family protein [Oscillospiraceae bacterium]
MKTVDALYSDMLSDFAARTGMTVSEGGDLSARLYAAAAQIYALYVQADWVNRQCFPQTAQGEYLDHHAQLRALERKAAARAEGTVRFFGDGASGVARSIPEGTVCMTPGLARFVTTQDGVLPAGQSHVDVPVQAVEAGSAGNVIAGSIRSMAAVPVGITGCTNPTALTGGADAEGDEQLRARIMDSFARLPNGANAAFYEQAALSFDEVAAAVALPRNRGVGTVDVVVASQQGMPDAALLDQVREHLRACKEIAVDVAVSAPEEVPVDIAVRIAGHEVDGLVGPVKLALDEWFCGQRLGQSVLRAKLGSLIYAVEGVENYDILEPARDIAVGKGQLPVLGTVTVEAMA